MTPRLLLAVVAMRGPAWLYDQTSEQGFRRLVLWLLTFSGLFMVVSGGSRVLARL